MLNGRAHSAHRVVAGAGAVLRGQAETPPALEDLGQLHAQDQLHVLPALHGELHHHVAGVAGDGADVVVGRRVHMEAAEGGGRSRRAAMGGLLHDHMVGVEQETVHGDKAGAGLLQLAAAHRHHLGAQVNEGSPAGR